MSEAHALRDAEVAFLDVETTGLDPLQHEILEIAIVDLTGQVLLDTKIRPVHIETATPIALQINGYADHPERWKDAPTFAEKAEEICKILRHRVLIGQNPTFDRSFIISGLTQAGIENPEKYVRRHTIDLTTLAWEHLVPCGLDRLNLDAICKFLGVPLNREERHGALDDTLATREAYLQLIRANENHRARWFNLAQSPAT